MEKIRQEENKQWMQMGVMALNTMAMAFTGREASVPTHVLPAVMPNVDDLSSSTAASDSDIDFDKCKRRKKQKRAQRKKRVKWQMVRSARKQRAAPQALVDLKKPVLDSPANSIDGPAKSTKSADSGSCTQWSPIVQRKDRRIKERSQFSVNLLASSSSDEEEECFDEEKRPLGKEEEWEKRPQLGQLQVAWVPAKKWLCCGCSCLRRESGEPNVSRQTNRKANNLVLTQQ